jgi:hypothetical protein
MQKKRRIHGCGVKERGERSGGGERGLVVSRVKNGYSKPAEMKIRDGYVRKSPQSARHPRSGREAPCHRNRGSIPN